MESSACVKCKVWGKKAGSVLRCREFREVLFFSMCSKEAGRAALEKCWVQKSTSQETAAILTKRRQVEAFL